jgi:hypothetical protein
MERRASGIALLLALAVAAPAFGADLQSTDRLDQGLERGVPAHSLQTGSNPSPHASSERFVGCGDTVLVHNSSCPRAASSVWKGAKTWRGGTRTNGQRGSSKEYCEWDHAHTNALGHIPDRPVPREGYAL